MSKLPNEIRSPCGGTGFSAEVHREIREEGGCLEEGDEKTSIGVSVAL